MRHLSILSCFSSPEKGCLWPLVRQCIYGQEGELIPSSDTSASGSRFGGDASQGSTHSFSRGSILLLYCFCGLQGSYLIWGLLQEKIMTQTYGNGESFRDSQFLVFINRILALCIAWVYLGVYERGTIRSLKEAPLYKYSYCAFSNIMSSWFQYEALKFVSFPTQVNTAALGIVSRVLINKGEHNYYFSILFWRRFWPNLVKLYRLC